METNRPAKEPGESLEQAARRLLAKMDARKRPAGERPAEILQIIRDSPSDEEAGEVAAVVCAFLSSQGLGDDKAVVVPANDNNRFRMTSGNGDGRAGLCSDYPLNGMLTVTAHPDPDDSVRYRSRGFALLKLRAPGDWEF